MGGLAGVGRESISRLGGGGGGEVAMLDVWWFLCRGECFSVCSQKLLELLLLSGGGVSYRDGILCVLPWLWLLSGRLSHGGRMPWDPLQLQCFCEKDWMKIQNSELPTPTEQHDIAPSSWRPVLVIVLAAGALVEQSFEFHIF